MQSVSINYEEAKKYQNCRNLEKQRNRVNFDKEKILKNNQKLQKE